MVWICILLFLYFQGFAHCTIFPFAKLPLKATGPEALAFDAKGGGPYTGAADGRILKYQGPNVGFVDFATTSPFRTKKFCDGTNGTLRSLCGGPRGLGFNYASGELYVVDSDFGLLMVKPHGGLATQIATSVNGKPIAFANALDIDQASQFVYFTDVGPIFRNIRNITQLLQSGDKSGKLFKYDPKTKQITLLLDGLSGPNGVAVSKDGSYVVVSEAIAKRIRIFWLRGPKRNSSKILINLQGMPDNIKRTEIGDFWVPVNMFKQQLFQTVVALGQRFNAKGFILQQLNFAAEFNDSISEIHEYCGKLYIGSLRKNFVGVYDYGL